MADNDAALGLIGVAVAVGGYFIARGAITEHRARRDDQSDFIEAHMRAAGISAPKENPLNEIVELGAILIVGTSMLLTASDWLLKQAGR